MGEVPRHRRCTENRGEADALIDIEKYTAERFGMEDGAIEWADVGAGPARFDGGGE